jgi:hypothetical protein
MQGVVAAFLGELPRQLFLALSIGSVGLHRPDDVELGSLIAIELVERLAKHQMRERIGENGAAAFRHGRSGWRTRRGGVKRRA